MIANVSAMLLDPDLHLLCDSLVVEHDIVLLDGKHLRGFSEGDGTNFMEDMFDAGWDELTDEVYCSVIEEIITYLLSNDLDFESIANIDGFTTYYKAP